MADNTGAMLTTIVFIIAFYIVMVFFCRSLYLTMLCVPEDKRAVPEWLCWLALIPIVTIVIFWIILPFALPQSFKRAMPDKPKVVKHSKVILGLGLAYMIVVTISWGASYAHNMILSIILAVAALVLFILYWVQVVKFQRLAAE